MTNAYEGESPLESVDSVYDLQESFRAALVLTGSVEGAERALSDAISMLGSEISPHGLLTESIRSILRHDATSKESASLPLELRALALLAPIPRCCFVLHLGVGLDIQTCSEILRLPTCEVEDALCQALVDLPRAYRLLQD